MGMSAARPLRIIVAPLVAAILTFGVWVTGGVLTDDFKTSVALTAAWFIVAGVACGWVAWSVRGLRLPVAVGYVATVVGLGGYLGWTSMHDEVVHERVVVGAPASRVAATPTASAPTRAPTQARTATQAPA